MEGDLQARPRARRPHDAPPVRWFAELGAKGQFAAGLRRRAHGGGAHGEHPAPRAARRAASAADVRLSVRLDAHEALLAYLEHHKDAIWTDTFVRVSSYVMSHRPPLGAADAGGGD